VPGSNRDRDINYTEVLRGFSAPPQITRQHLKTDRGRFLPHFPVIINYRRIIRRYIDRVIDNFVK
jgi:hypothetical protein